MKMLWQLLADLKYHVQEQDKKIQKKLIKFKQRL